MLAPVQMIAGRVSGLQKHAQELAKFWMGPSCTTSSYKMRMGKKEDTCLLLDPYPPPARLAGPVQ